MAWFNCLHCTRVFPVQQTVIRLWEDILLASVVYYRVNTLAQFDPDQSCFFSRLRPKYFCKMYFNIVLPSMLWSRRVVFLGRFISKGSNDKFTAWFASADYRDTEIELRPIRNLSAVGGEWSALRPGRFTSGRDQVPNCAGRCVGLGAGLIGHGKITHAVIRTPHRPVRSKSLYHLRYPGHQNFDYISHFPNMFYMSCFSHIVYSEEGKLRQSSFSRELL